MVLKIYGGTISPLVKLVAAVCREKEVPYEVVNVDMHGDAHKTPAFRQFQPFGQVPYIDDDGFILYEARAICRYLVKRYEGQGTPGLVPTSDVKSEALFEQAASVEHSNFYPFVLELVKEQLIKKRKNLPVDEARVKSLLAELNGKLDVYEVILGKQSFLAGQSITLVDIFHVPSATIVIEMLGYNILENRPNLARWWDAISTRPTWLAVKASA